MLITCVYFLESILQVECRPLSPEVNVAILYILARGWCCVVDNASKVDTLISFAVAIILVDVFPFID